MTQYAFGTGTLIGKRTDVANTPPFMFGVLQDVSIDFDQKLESLIGQNKVAVALGDGELKITGKAKAARIQMTEMANLFFGATTSTSAGLDMVIPGENATTATTTYQVANHALTPIEDFGLFYTATGIQLTPVASGPTTGQYSFVPSTGTYTIAAGDENMALTAYYTFTPASGVNAISSFANPVQGSSPVFEIWFKNLTPNFGVTKVTNFKLNACKSSKLSFGFSNQKFMIPEFDFQCMADASSNVFTITTTE